MSRRVVIGDIHGCFDELRDLLDLIGPGEDDRILAVGDLVNRGPYSEDVLEFFRDQPNAHSVQGNSEYRHCHPQGFGSEGKIGYRLAREQLGPRYAEWVEFMNGLPLRVETPEAYVAHGCFEPGVPFGMQRDDVTLGLPAGEDYLAETLDGTWYAHYDGEKPLIVGHHHYLRNQEPLIVEGRVYAIDTGCARGGRLTAVVLPEFAVFSVPARKDYWTPIRSKYPLG